MIKEFLERNPNPIQPGYVFALLPEKTKDVYHRYIKRRPILWTSYAKASRILSIPVMPCPTFLPEFRRPRS
jgi:hypothetical protein